MLGLPAHHWVHLAGISGGEILYLGSSIFVIIYPALSAAIRGRDGMDGGRAFWMTFYFWKSIKIDVAGSGMLLGAFGGDFGWEILYLGSSIFVIIYSALSAAIRGRDGMDGGRAIWMTFYFWKCHQN